MISKMESGKLEVVGKNVVVRGDANIFNSTISMRNCRIFIVGGGTTLWLARKSVLEIVDSAIWVIGYNITIMASDGSRIILSNDSFSGYYMLAPLSVVLESSYLQVDNLVLKKVWNITARFSSSIRIMNSKVRVPKISIYDSSDFIIYESHLYSSIIADTTGSIRIYYSLVNELNVVDYGELILENTYVEENFLLNWRALLDGREFRVSDFYVDNLEVSITWGVRDRLIRHAKLYMMIIAFSQDISIDESAIRRLIILNSSGITLEKVNSSRVVLVNVSDLMVLSSRLSYVYADWMRNLTLKNSTISSITTKYSVAINIVGCRSDLELVDSSDVLIADSSFWFLSIINVTNATITNNSVDYEFIVKGSSDLRIESNKLAEYMYVDPNIFNYNSTFFNNTMKSYELKVLVNFGSIQLEDFEGGLLLINGKSINIRNSELRFVELVNVNVVRIENTTTSYLGKIHIHSINNLSISNSVISTHYGGSITNITFLNITNCIINVTYMYGSYVIMNSENVYLAKNTISEGKFRIVNVTNLTFLNNSVVDVLSSYAGVGNLTLGNNAFYTELKFANIAHLYQWNNTIYNTELIVLINLANTNISVNSSVVIADCKDIFIYGNVSALMQISSSENITVYITLNSSESVGWLKISNSENIFVTGHIVSETLKMKIEHSNGVAFKKVHFETNRLTATITHSNISFIRNDIRIKKIKLSAQFSQEIAFLNNSFYIDDVELKAEFLGSFIFAGNVQRGDEYYYFYARIIDSAHLKFSNNSIILDALIEHSDFVEVENSRLDFFCKYVSKCFIKNSMLKGIDIEHSKNIIIENTKNLRVRYEIYFSPLSLKNVINASVLRSRFQDHVFMYNSAFVNFSNCIFEDLYNYFAIHQSILVYLQHCKLYLKGEGLEIEESMYVVLIGNAISAKPCVREHLIRIEESTHIYFVENDFNLACLEIDSESDVYIMSLSSLLADIVLLLVASLGLSMPVYLILELRELGKNYGD